MFDTKHFPKAQYFWHQGKFYNWESTHIHAMSHVAHYGSSCFEGIRAYDTDKGAAIFRLDDHITRFFHSASVINMEVPYSKKKIMALCQEVLQKNGLMTAYIRPNLFFGYGNLGLIPHAAPVELSVASWQWGAYLGEEAIKNGIRALILPWKRIHRSQIDNQAKLGGIYVQSNIGGSYARQQGYNEGIYLNIEGHIAEGPGENIIIVNNGVVKTNDDLSSVLEGITRQSILKIAGDLGYDTKIGIITKEEIFNADEVFFTGTAAEITPIVSITDGSNPDQPVKEYTIGTGKPGEVTLQLAEIYKDIVHGRKPEYDHWLTHVAIEEVVK